MMIKLSAASAAMLLLCLAGSPSAYAYCDEDCAAAHEEAAYEHATAREEAAEEGYGRYPRQDERAAAMERQAMREREASREASKRREQSREEARRLNAKRVAEPDPAPKSEPAPSSEKQRPRSKVASENSSITIGTTQIAEDNTPAGVPSRREVGCKTFFPSAGMTLSVPCD
jgi:hypothetical protein